MCTLKLFVILLLALLVLGVLAFVFDSVKETESYNPNYPTRAYKIARACSFIVKFGMVLTACGIIGSLIPAGLGLAMAFAVPEPTRVPKGSWFDHSHNVMTTIPFGAVIPVDWRFMQPGEKFKQNLSGFCRALMLKAPAMQDVDLKYATYFVPFRLLNDKFEQVVAAPDNNPQLDIRSSLQLDPISTTAVLGTSLPFFNLNKNYLNTLLPLIKRFKKSDSSGFDFDAFYSALRYDGSVSSVLEAKTAASKLNNWRIGSLLDYMGLPVMSDDELNKICEFYSKNSSTLTSFNINLKSKPINVTPFQAYQAICNHFFIPDFQRRSDIQSRSGSVIRNIHSELNGLQTFDTLFGYGLFNLRYSQYESDPYTFAKTEGYVRRIATSSEVQTGNSGGVAFNANTIRSMFDLDEFARKVERFYGDLRKQIKYMFGIVTSDKSAMSPILVDAGSCPVGVSEVQNTALAPVDSAQSQSLGKMTAALGKRYDTFEVEEQGVLMTCVWLRPRTAYMNKLPYMFGQCLDFATFPNPLFAEVGDIALSAYDVDYDPFGWIRKQADTGNTVAVLDRSNDTFGYNTRYVPWKYSLDTVSGDFRGPLAYWTCAREFEEENVIIDDSQTQDAFLSAGSAFNMINGYYDRNEQPLNRIFAMISDVPDVRPFQLQLRFNTSIWQLYPHIEDEM